MHFSDIQKRPSEQKQAVITATLGSERTIEKHETAGPLSVSRRSSKGARRLGTEAP